MKKGVNLHKFWQDDETGGHYGIKDEAGDVVFEPKFDDVKFISNDKFIFSTDGKYGLMNINSDIIIEPKFDQIESYYDDAVIVSFCKGIMRREFGLISTDGKELTEVKYRSISRLNNGLHLLKFVDENSSDKFMLLNSKYEFITDIAYDDIKYDDIFIAYLNGKFELRDDNFKLLTPLKFDWVSGLIDSRRVALIDGQYYLMNSDLQIIQKDIDGINFIQIEYAKGLNFIIKEAKINPMLPQVNKFKSLCENLLNQMKHNKQCDTNLLSGEMEILHQNIINRSFYNMYLAYRSKFISKHNIKGDMIKDINFIDSLLDSDIMEQIKTTPIENYLDTYFEQMSEIGDTMMYEDIMQSSIFTKIVRSGLTSIASFISSVDNIFIKMLDGYIDKLNYINISDFADKMYNKRAV